jgi:hypothetical protein
VLAAPLEMALALLLLAVGTREVFVAALVFTVVATLLLVVARARGYAGGCQCFGPGIRSPLPLEVARSAAVVSLAFAGAYASDGTPLWGRDPGIAVESVVLGLALVLLLGLTAFAIPLILNPRSEKAS